MSTIVGRSSVERLARRLGGRPRIVLDAVAWYAAILAAMALHAEAGPVPEQMRRSGELLGLALLLHYAIGAQQGLYTRRWRVGSMDEVAALLRTVLASTVILGALTGVVRGVAGVGPRSVVTAGLIAVQALTTWRLLTRRLDEGCRRLERDGLARVVVVGAGEAGAMVVREMLRDPASPYLPVALVDDDPAKRNVRIDGVLVHGPLAVLRRTVEETCADTVLLAIPSADAATVRQLTQHTEGLGVDVLVLPPIDCRFRSAVGVDDIRPLSHADLLGRHQVEIDLSAVAGYLSGKRVLVTGAGGSIGAELCRQVHRFGPQRLLMLDRDESALHAVQLEIEGRTLVEGGDLVLADIRDTERLRAVFAEHRPQVVFHAAALKHLPFLECFPDEGVKTNVFGTLHVLSAAAEAGVERFVNISTDKAAEPVSVLGCTKRIAERLTAWMASRTPGAFISVRFGNVLGSRGSVLTTFAAQIEAGLPVTVTDPEVTRYFMTVEEAVQLVIQAGAVGRDGEVLVLDMGEPVRIADVARRMIAASGKDVEIHYTGLRPGEKLHERRLAGTEADLRPLHPLISHVSVPALREDEVEALRRVRGRVELQAELRGIACSTGDRVEPSRIPAQRSPSSTRSASSADAP